MPSTRKNVTVADRKPHLLGYTEVLSGTTPLLSFASAASEQILENAVLPNSSLSRAVASATAGVFARIRNAVGRPSRFLRPAEEILAQLSGPGGLHGTNFCSPIWQNLKHERPSLLIHS